VIITTASGSYLYWSLGNGSFSVPWSSGSLNYGNALYTVGDMNGDGIADMILLDRLGSWFDLGSGGGGWTGIYSTGSLKL
jgi:hypothetical protein